MKLILIILYSILSCGDLLSRSQNSEVTESRPRKRASSSSLMSPDSTLMPSLELKGQITQPIQLVHAATFPPPPSPVKPVQVSSTCATPDLPPPPTPLLPMEEEVKPPPKAATMNLQPLDSSKIGDASMNMDEAYDEVVPCVYDDVDVKYDGIGNAFFLKKKLQLLNF